MVTHLLASSLFFVLVTLMDEKMIGHNEERYAAEVHLEETSRLIGTISREPFVAPIVSGKQDTIPHMSDSATTAHSPGAIRQKKRRTN